MNINDMPLISADLSESFLFPPILLLFFSCTVDYWTDLVSLLYTETKNCYSQDVKDD